MSPRPLNNDRTNYLIWRYLQEHGHAQTAARFQIDWGNENPDNLSFAQFIKTHSLVYLLQKGLRYHELECQLNKDPEAKPFFGPEEAASAQASKQAARDDDSATTRKHARDSIVNGSAIDSSPSSLSAQAPAAKRTRRSNGQNANGAASRGAKSGDAMEIDESNTKRDPPSNYSPSATSTTTAGLATTENAQSDMRMDIDSDQKDSSSNRETKGEPKSEATAGITNGVHATATANTNLGTSGGRAGSEDDVTGAGGAVAAAASSTGSGGGDNLIGSTSGMAATAASPELSDQGHRQQLFEGQVAGQAASTPKKSTIEGGESVGVQSDKVTDLGPETAVLKVPGKNVTHALWSPRDPALLATAGDALCRLWTLSNSVILARSGSNNNNSTQHSNANSPNGAANGLAGTQNGAASGDGGSLPHFLNLDSNNIVDLHDEPNNSVVTAMAWRPDGERIAVARHTQESSRHGEVTIHSKSGDLVDELPGGMDMVTNLFWNPTGTLLLGISHSDDSNTTLMVWDHRGSLLKPLDLEHVVQEAAWRDELTFVVCGYNLIAHAEVSETGIGNLQTRSDLGEPQEWSRISHDTITKITAVASGETGSLALIGPEHELRTTQAHHSQITSLTFQPLTNPTSLGPDAPRLFATGDVEGHIKIWDARRPFEVVHSLDLQKPTPALAVSFTPDGYLIAGASWESILFWNAEAGGAPKAVWDGPSVGLQNSPNAANGHNNAENGDVAMSDDDDGPQPPLLNWDADGGKVAFAAKDQIAIVSFRR